MLIARQKKQENIAEYILYMYQIEDLLRAVDFDIETVMKNYVEPQLPDKSFLGEYRNWFTDIIDQMKSQRIQKKGHLVDIREIIMELSYLHNTLLNATKDEKYKGVVDRAVPFIEEFKTKSNLKDKNYIEVALHAMYMKLLLKLQKKEISAETEEAFDAMRMLLAYLSRAYKKMKAGDLDFLNN